MTRVYLAVFGSGMGHASRMSALAQELVSSGDKVMFSSSGEVTMWLRKKGYSCNDLPLVDVAFKRTGAFSATETLKFLPRISAHFFEQLRLEVANLERFAPQVVVSDSVASTIVASKLLGVRTISILNQLRLISSPRTPRTIAKFLTAASVAVGSAFWNLYEEILIPDLPPPHTISEMNLWNAGRASAKAKYIGFLTPKRATAQEGDDLLEKWRRESKRRRVFWQISGPPATRKPFLTKALEAAKALRDGHLFVITAGNPGGPSSPTPVPGGYLYQWCNSSSDFIDCCDLVVSRAGHVSVSDYILRGKPALLVPIPAQTEQMGNANKAQKLGVAIAIEERALDPQAVGEALKELSADRYAERVLEMKRLAESYDALRSILDVLRRG